jgi:hypothetical protein
LGCKDFRISLRAAIPWQRSNLRIIQGIASGEKHTCPGGRCQGARPRNDLIICFSAI